MGTVVSDFSQEMTMPTQSTASASSGLPKFHLGRTVMTRGVQAHVVSGRLDPTPFLRRHHRGDWGDLCDSDKRANDQGVRSGGRLMSSYKVNESLTLWIITEWGRSVTTLLLPSEY